MTARTLLLLAVSLLCACRKQPAQSAAAPAFVEAPGATIDQRIDGGTVRFIAVGDTGKGTDDQQKVADAMAKVCHARGCDFVVLLGDNLYPTGAASPTDPEFDAKFERVYANVGVPFYPVLGNHDYGGHGNGREFAKGMNEVSHSEHSKLWRMPSAYWRLRAGPVELFGLDTNMQMYGFDARQRAEVQTWVSESTAQWRISAAHHPYLSDGPHGNAGSYDEAPEPASAGKEIQSFFDDLLCGKLDLALAGHDHNKQWLRETCNGTQFVISGGGAEHLAPDNKKPVHFEAATLGFFYVAADAHRLQGEFIDADGGVEFHRELAK